MLEFEGVDVENVAYVTSKLEKLFTEQVFNMESNTLYFPIRHHSPACAYHVLQVLESYKPDVVLIEGPEIGSKLIPVLAHEETKPPVSLYYSYELGEERYAFYYPLLEFSPEYAVLKQAVSQGIDVQFIDKNYSTKPQDSKAKASLQDENLLASSQFIISLCTKLNCRSFNELWEKVFEIEGVTKTPVSFASEVFTYCTLSRLCYEEEDLRLEGNLARESFMREHIERAKEKYQRVLVVTGGFHTYGLVNELVSPLPSSVETQQYKTLPDADAIQEQIYPMVYTFKEADQLNGYASGMPYVNYYQHIWKELRSRRALQAFSKGNLSMLSQLSKMLRKSEETVSTSDGIEAYAMIQGLANLRQKSEGGVYELQDGVLSSFVKGEDIFANVKPLEMLSSLLTGDAIGKIVPNEFVPPIVNDFKEKCTAFKLHMKATGQHRKHLDLYSNDTHREISQLMHCAAYLGIGFASKKSGPDLVNYVDVHLVRESWTYTYSSLVESRLVEYASYGGTVKEAVIRKIEEELESIPSHHSKEHAKWLMRSHLMGLESLSGSLFEKTQQALYQDGSFLSLCGTLSILNLMYSHPKLLGIRDHSRLPMLIAEAYDQAVSRLHQIHHSQPDEHHELIQSLKLLGMLAGDADSRFDSERLMDDLSDLLMLPDLAPILEGACIAILAQSRPSHRPEIVTRAQSYMLGTPDKIKLVPSYLQGIFVTARDVLLYDDILLHNLNQLFMTLPHEEFIEMLPELRYAFTHFTTAEIRLIMKQIAGFHQVPVTKLEQEGISEVMLMKAKLQDEAIRKEFAKWNLI